MKIDPKKIYLMPLVMGPQYDRQAIPAIKYPQVESFVLQFQTDREAALRVVPDCYEIGDAPVVTVAFGYYKGIDFLAGGDYNTALVQVEASFNGEVDQVEGDCFLVMFEDKTTPILGGREYLGVPKVYADIPPFKLMPDGHYRCEVSLFGHLLFGLELLPMKKQNRIVKYVAGRRINSRPWLGYKHIPALDGPPDADYPTITRNDITVKNLWMGNSGSLYFGSAGEKEIADAAKVVSAIRSLPVVKFEQVLYFAGSAVLRLDQSRRLR